MPHIAVCVKTSRVAVKAEADADGNKARLDAGRVAGLLRTRLAAMARCRVSPCLALAPPPCSLPASLNACCMPA